MYFDLPVSELAAISDNALPVSHGNFPSECESMQRGGRHKTLLPLAIGLCIAAATMSSVGLVGSADAQTARTWSVNGTYADIIATDCRDCGDDIGILFACRGEGLPARVSVPWLATENGPAGMTLPLEMTIGNQRFVYNATLTNPGQAGHVPEFFMNPHDPALDALMSGRSAQLVFDGVQANIGLKSSRSALSIFKAHCGWNNVPVTAQFSNGEPVGSGGSFPPSGEGGQQADAPNTDLSWFANFYPEGEGDGPTGTLAFGIPETDAIVFDAVCRLGKSPMAEVRLGLGLRTLTPGQSVRIYIEPNGANHEFPGTAFQAGGGEYEGMEARISLSDPVWQAMADASAPFVMGAYGGAEATVRSEGASAAIGQFLQACQQDAVQAAIPNPSEQQHQPTEDPAPAVPSQPQAELPVQSDAQQQSEAQPVQPQQPQTAQPETQQPEIQQSEAHSAAVIDGSYACSDGSNLLVAVTKLGASEIANIVRNGTEVLALEKQQAEGAGTRFSDGTSNLIAINGILMLADADGGASCQKK